MCGEYAKLSARVEEKKKSRGKTEDVCPVWRVCHRRFLQSPLDRPGRRRRVVAVCLL